MACTSLTRLLKANNICDIGHVDPTFQLKTGFPFRRMTRLVFIHHQFGLLLVGVDVLATQQDALEEEDVILETTSAKDALWL